MRHSVLRELLAFLFFAVASILMTWPLAAHLNSAISDPGDPYVSMAILDWDLYATLHHPARLFHQPIFYPAPYALAFTEHLYGIALPLLPFYLAGIPLIALYNVAVLLGFTLCGYGAYVAGRLITGSFAAGLIGGLFFAFVPYRITQLPHISYVWAGWLPLLFAALLFYDEKPTRNRAILFGAAFFMNGLTTLHWLIMGAFAAFLTAMFLWIVRRHDRRYLLRLGMAAVVAIIFLLPFLIPYQIVRDMYQMRRSAEETEIFSARVQDWFVSERYLPYGRLFMDHINGERWLFPGFVPLFLAGAGLLLYRGRESQVSGPESGPGSRDQRPGTRWLRTLDVLIIVTAVWSIIELATKESWSAQIGPRLLFRIGANPLAPMLFMILLLARLSIRIPHSRDRSLFDSVRQSRSPMSVWVALIWLGLGVLGSLGLNNFFYSFLFDYVRVFRAIRVPARWAMIAYVGLAVLISCGASALARRDRRGGLIVLTIASALLVVELSPAPRYWYLANSTPSPVYRWLASTAIRGSLLELPLALDGIEYAYMKHVPVHRKPMVGGVSSFIPPQHGHLSGMTHAQPISDDLMRRLEELRCSIIVVHADWLGPLDRSTREWLAQQIRAGRLTFVRRFPHDQRGDYVFAVTKTEPQAAFLREPERPDRTGSTPLQHLQTFLGSNSPTYFDSTIAALEPLTPSPWSLGELNISGWAVSPRGIRQVNLRFYNGEVIIAADRYPRPEFSGGLMPWYPETRLAGFRKEFASRPKWAHDTGDLQIEIIDGQGTSHLLDPVFFNWREPDDFRRWDFVDQNAMHELIYRIYRRHDSLQVRRAKKTGLTADEIVYALTRRHRKKEDRIFIERCYWALFNRLPDDADRRTYLNELRAGKSRPAVVRSMIRSPGFRRLYLGR